jgi:hypothetical protein
MVLSIYTRVRADDPPAGNCIMSLGNMQSTQQAVQMGTGDCPACENNGDPFPVKIDGHDYMQQPRAIKYHTVSLIQCEAHSGTTCNPQAIDTSFSPPCNDTLTPGTGTI